MWENEGEVEIKVREDRGKKERDGTELDQLGGQTRTSRRKSHKIAIVCTTSGQKRGDSTPETGERGRDTRTGGRLSV